MTNPPAPARDRRPTSRPSRANHVDRDRRRLLIGAAAASAGWITWPATALSRSSLERVRVAAVGVGGKGWTDVNGAAEHADIVAFCDVQEASGGKRKGGFAAAAGQFAKAHRYVDWREMLEKEHRRVDGITVSVPDHMHAPITMTALKLGLACYTQKPLTRTVHEARQLTAVAASQQVATQMGNQHHNGKPYRTLAELIRRGVVGKIREAHTWSNRPIWPQGIDRPEGSQPVPEGLHWDLWLGVAPARPFVKDVYHPFNWRGWYDFGAGALGDMGCHIIDPVVWSLDLGPVLRVQYHGPAPRQETFPKQERLDYVFAPTRYTAGGEFRMSWYDGGLQPKIRHPMLPDDLELPTNGNLLIGERGAVLTAHGSRAMPQLYPRGEFQDTKIEPLESINHYGQWIDAIAGRGTTTSHFGYAGPLTETVLLGTIACRIPNRELAWDAARAQFTNHSRANRLVAPSYREGWHVPGLG